MATFSKISEYRLSTCHPDLVLLFNEVIKVIDCEVTEGYRGRIEQEKAFSEGRSKEHYPYGKHNQMPSMAADVYITPVDMVNFGRFFWFAGYTMAVADNFFAQGKMKHRVKWGGSWDRDYQLSNEKGLRDYVHFELIVENPT